MVSGSSPPSLNKNWCGDENDKKNVSRHGFLDTMVTHDGPLFYLADFEKFAHDYDSGHITESYRYPQANGEVERMLQTSRCVILTSKDPYLALRAYRATPGILISSPAGILMGEHPQA